MSSIEQRRSGLTRTCPDPNLQAHRKAQLCNHNVAMNCAHEYPRGVVRWSTQPHAHWLNGAHISDSTLPTVSLHSNHLHMHTHLSFLYNIQSRRTVEQHSSRARSQLADTLAAKVRGSRYYQWGCLFRLIDLNMTHTIEHRYCRQLVFNILTSNATQLGL